MSKKNVKRKHIPKRTCVGCREVLPKRSLIRIVRNQQGILIDPTGKLPGRGAYLHDRYSCWEKGLQGALAHSLKTDLREEEKNRLNEFAETNLKEDSNQEVNTYKE